MYIQKSKLPLLGLFFFIGNLLSFMSQLLGREKVVAVLFTGCFKLPSHPPPFSIQRFTTGYPSSLKPVYASDEERPGGTPKASYTHTAKMVTLTPWKSVYILLRWTLDSVHCLALVIILNWQRKVIPLPRRVQTQGWQSAIAWSRARKRRRRGLGEGVGRCWAETSFR